MLRKGFITFATGSTVVDHLPQNPKNEGSNPVVCNVALVLQCSLCTAGSFISKYTFNMTYLVDQVATAV